MPRQARVDAPGALQHIIVRGIERREIFRDDTDRDNFLDRLGTILLETKTGCYAWALIPNHFHLLLRTGNVPVSIIMQRLLTGYAVYYNRRHCRHGHLFQNRYKSILCQKNVYLLELVRYLHLNPLRAGLISDFKAMDTYPYCGHAVMMGGMKKEWQDDGYVLNMYDSRLSSARQKYSRFVQEGIAAGRKDSLTGGGLVRSSGGWDKVKKNRKAGEWQRGDERILGDSVFVEQVLKEAREQLNRKTYLQAQGYDLEKIAVRVSELIGCSPEEVLGRGKYRQTVLARSILCYFANHELEISQTVLAARFGLSQPAISMAVKRGEAIVKREDYRLDGNL